MLDTCASVESYIRKNQELYDLLELPASSSISVELLARGEYNENYVFTHPQTGKKLVFRINLGSQMHLSNQIAYEARALQLLAPSGRTPQLYFVSNVADFDGTGILIEEWLPGRSLSYETDLAEAAAILADIHSVPVPDDHGLIAPEHPLQNIVDECVVMFAGYSSWQGADAQIVKRVDSWIEQCQQGAERRMATAPDRRCLVNTELNSRNFLINTNTHGAQEQMSYLVDWEKPLVAYKEQDLAHFLVPTTTFWKTDHILSKEQRSSFLLAYEHAVAGRFDTAGTTQQLDDYLAANCLRGITWSAMALAQHTTGERLVADDYTLAKIRTFLEPDFLDMLQKEFFSQLHVPA